MRRILVAGCSLVILALAGVLSAGVGAQTVGPPTAAAHRPPARVVVPRVLPSLTGGSTCFVSVPRCSQTPCVELIASNTVQTVGAVAAVGRVQPLPARPAPTQRCGFRRAVPKAMIINRPGLAAGGVDLSMLPRLRTMAAQLAARHH